MNAPTIVKQTKEYMLVKIPLPQARRFGFLPKLKAEPTAAEKRALKMIAEGEREYSEGKTIRASSIDEALAIEAKRKHAVHRIRN